MTRIALMISWTRVAWLLLFFAAACGETVSGIEDGDGADAVEWPGDRHLDWTDVQVIPADHSASNDTVSVPLQQPTVRAYGRFDDTGDFIGLAVQMTIRPPFIADGLHGYERISDSCVTRRMQGWPLLDIGPISFSYVDRQSTILWREGEYLANLRFQSIVEGTILTVSGGGGNHLGRFNLSARTPPLFRAIFPSARPATLRQPLPVTQAFEMRWVPLETPYLMLVDITAHESNAVLIKAYCRTSASSGVYRLPSSVIESLRNASDVALSMGLSDEIQMQVGVVPVSLTTVFYNASAYFD